MAKTIVYVAAIVAITTLPLICCHSLYYGFNATQACLALFLSVNVIICVWEIGLFVNRNLIKQQYQTFLKTVDKDELPSPMFLFDDVTLAEVLTLKHWALVWSTYSLIDPRYGMIIKMRNPEFKHVTCNCTPPERSYSDTKSLGFCVDCGNGVVTILPSILFAVSMTWPIISARLLGIIGLLKFYMEFYGTVLYFFSFFINNRHLRKRAWHLWLVAGTNGFWIVGPAFGLYVCWNMIWSNDYSMFQ